MPHLALPSLTAFLRGNGVETVQRDLNVAFYDQVLTHRHLDVVLQRIERGQRRSRVRHMLPPEQVELESWALAEGRRVAERVQRAKDVLRSPRFYDTDQGLEAFVTVADGLKLASVPYFPSRLYFTGYDAPYPLDASQAIVTALRDRQHNMFYDVFQLSVIPQIIREQPDIVGISLTSALQIMAGLTIAHLIREAGIDTHITLGGKMVTCWRDQLPQAEALSYLYDSAVVYAGEQSLLALTQVLEQGGDLGAVPNLIYRDKGKPICTDIVDPCPVQELPPPDLEGLPLETYFTPEPVLPISGARGCYWHRCAFCNVGHGESRHYEEKQAARVVDEMISLAETYQVERFFFCDEAVSPRIMKSVARRIQEAGHPFKWAAAARFEPGLRAETLHDMAQGGCQMLLYGLESGSARILERMNKGTKLDVVRRVLKDGAEAGIWNHLFFFFGFPGETLDDAQETINFVYENAPYVHSICTGTFMLEAFSEVAADPERFGVRQVLKPQDRDLIHYYDYRVSEGLTAQQAERVEAFLLDALPDKENAHIYYHDIFRFLYAARLQGQPLPSFLDT